MKAICISVAAAGVLVSQRAVAPRRRRRTRVPRLPRRRRQRGRRRPQSMHPRHRGADRAYQRRQRPDSSSTPNGTTCNWIDRPTRSTPPRSPCCPSPATPTAAQLQTAVTNAVGAPPEGTARPCPASGSIASRRSRRFRPLCVCGEQQHRHHRGVLAEQPRVGDGCSGADAAQSVAGQI